jgi:plastocyanin
MEMMVQDRRRRIVRLTLLLLAIADVRVWAQGVDVTAHVLIQTKHGMVTPRKGSQGPADVVVWLSPLQADSRAATTGHPGPFRLVQKDKMFTPHLLIVPTGSSVEFPNRDPFFHNVFSLFNGKRFDLGLYESGSSRAVRFDREGISYIFCNIHPEMGAVVLSLSTPYYGVSNTSGDVEIRNVPPGSYRLHVWSEVAKSANPVDTDKTVQVGSSPVHLGDLPLDAATEPMILHKNKFGEDYHPSPTTPY